MSGTRAPNRQFKKGSEPWNKGLKGTHFSPETEFKKGDIPWNSGLTKKTSNKVKEMIRKTAHTRKELFEKGVLQSNYVEYWSTLKGQHISPETEFKKGIHPSTEFTSDGMKEKWRDLEWKGRQIKAILKGLCKRPTCVEREFMEIVKNHNLPYKYVGDGSFLIGYKNPDFINTNGQKICIEVAARIFAYHNPNDVYEEKRKKHFGNYGWDCLVFWADKRGLEDREKIIETLQQIQEVKKI